jgi:hypothetical protein
MDGFVLEIRDHALIKDDEGRDALRVNYEFVNMRETAIPTEKCIDRAFQNDIELERGTVNDDDGSFPYPVRNGGGIDGWGVYILLDKSPVTVNYYNIDDGSNAIFLSKTFEL